MADQRDVLSRLKHGANFPYDAPDAWWKQPGEPEGPPATDWAHRAARGVLADLGDRNTIKRGFEGIDEVTRFEIVDTLAAIIRQAQTDG